MIESSKFGFVSKSFIALPRKKKVSINRRERCIVSVMYRSPPPRIGAIRPLPSRFLSTNSGGFHGAVRPRSVSRKRWHAQRLTNVSEGPVQRSNWSWGELEIYVDEWFTAWFTADSRILIDHLFPLFKGEIFDSFAKSVLKEEKEIHIKHFLVLSRRRKQWLEAT